MLTISQSATNQIRVTLKEKSKATYTPSVYLIRLVNDQTKQETLAILGNDLSDQSDYPKRYNEWPLIEKVSPNNVAGEVRLSDTGFYHYYIYEQASAINMDYTLSDREVESGKAMVPGTYQPGQTKYTPDTDFTVHK